MPLTPEQIECWYDWDTFRQWMGLVHPEIPVPNQKDGCVDELKRLFRNHTGLQDDLIQAIRQAPGDRASVIYEAQEDGWWPEEEVVADIRQAPGERAWAIYQAHEEGWWPEEEVVADIRQAPGDRASVIYRAQEDGWWPEGKEEDNVADAGTD